MKSLLMVFLIGMLSGCAALSDSPSNLSELKALCDSVAPCEPCPPCPPPQVCPETPALPEAPTAEADDNGFIWKPESDNDGRLAIITPAMFDFKSVNIFYGKKNESGRYFGRGNGNRQTWRFNRVGSFYGKNIKVVGTQSDGTQKSWTIPRGSTRFEQRVR